MCPHRYRQTFLLGTGASGLNWNLYRLEIHNLCPLPVHQTIFILQITHQVLSHVTCCHTSRVIHASHVTFCHTLRVVTRHVLYMCHTSRVVTFTFCHMSHVIYASHVMCGPTSRVVTHYVLYMHHALSHVMCYTYVTRHL